VVVSVCNRLSMCLLPRSVQPGFLSLLFDAVSTLLLYAFVDCQVTSQTTATATTTTICSFCSASFDFTERHHASAVYTIIMYLSICLSQIGVLLKRLNVGSRKQCHTIAQGLYSFLMPKISAKLYWCRLNRGAKCRWGRLKLATFNTT